MFKKLFCDHDYQLVDTVRYYTRSYAYTKVYMCNKCGKVKKIKY